MMNERRGKSDFCAGRERVVEDAIPDKEKLLMMFKERV